MAAIEIQVKNLTKEFGDHAVLKDISFTVPAGSLTTLLGPSGCGKTTLLRILSGLETATSGEIYFQQKPVLSLPPQKRDTALVFQTYALFPHMTVFENIAFGLQIKKIPKEEIKKRVAKILHTVGLAGLENRFPAQLSGGQQQRVALARALIVEPSVLLFDEPLSNLDARLREQMRLEIRKLQKQTGITAIYVTHDQEEAMAISDQIIILYKGKIEQKGTPYEIYNFPATKFVASFVGRANFLKAFVKEKEKDYAVVSCVHKELIVPAPPFLAPGQEVELMIRPEHIQILEGEGFWKGEVLSLLYLGASCFLEIQLEEEKITLLAEAPRAKYQEKDKVEIGFDPNESWLLPSP